MLVGEILEGNARRQPDRLAWRFRGESWNWAEANRRVNRLANALTQAGLAAQDRVALFADNSHRLAEVYFALAKAGLIAVPINPRSVAREIDFVIGETGARGLFVSSRLAPRLAGTATDLGSLPVVVGMEDGHGLGTDYEAFIAAAPDDEPATDFSDGAIRAIKYTSGTTGAPKGVISTHRQYLFSVLNYLPQFPFAEDDRCLLVLPMTAGVGIQMLTAYAYRALPTTILAGFDANEVLDTVEAERITRLFAVPTVIAGLADAQGRRARDLSFLRLLEYGGAPAPVSMIDRAVRVLGVPFAQVYGASETGGLIAFLGPADHSRLLQQMTCAARASEPMPCGREAQGYHIRLVDDAGRDVPEGEVGEMAVRADSLTSGYWNRPDLTEEVLRGSWLYTGDLARRDEEGFLTIVDRKRDVIIVGGVNVYSAEVEAVLAEHPCVREVAIVGEPDDRLGETVTACVVVRPDVSEAEAEQGLAAFAETNLAGHKRPARYRFLDALPQTSSGKVRKVELVEAIQSGGGVGRSRDGSEPPGR